MKRRGPILPMLLFLTAGCEPLCTPGEVRAMSNTVQRFGYGLRLIDFNIDIGECEPGRVPTPRARVVGPNKRIGGATVKIDQREAELRAGKWPRLAVGTIEAEPAEPGESIIELEFPTVTRWIAADLVEVVDAPRARRLDRFCWPPLRVAGDTVSCVTAAPDGGYRVIEFHSGGTVELGVGSWLWATPNGHLITANGGIGWLPQGQPLGAWAPVAELADAAVGVAAAGDLVLVLREQVLELRRASDLAVAGTMPLNRSRAKGIHRLAFDGERALAAGFRHWETNNAEEYAIESFAVGDGGISAGSLTLGLSEVVITTHGGVYWTTDLNERWLRGYSVSSPPLADPEFQIRSLGGCGGSGDRPSCASGGTLGPLGLTGRFLQCPFIDDGGVRFVSIALRGSELGHCDGQFAYAGQLQLPGDDDGYLDVIDLSPYIESAPYRSPL